MFFLKMRDAGACAGHAPGGGGAPARRMERLQLDWMCAEAVVFVPLPVPLPASLAAGTGGRQEEEEGVAGQEWGQAAETYLAAAAAAVHEGEEPTVEVPAPQIAALAERQQAGDYAVRAELELGSRQAMCLRLVCRPRAQAGG